MFTKKCFLTFCIKDIGKNIQPTLLFKDQTALKSFKLAQEFQKIFRGSFVFHIVAKNSAIAGRFFCEFTLLKISRGELSGSFRLSLKKCVSTLKDFRNFEPWKYSNSGQTSMSRSLTTRPS